MGDMVRVGVDIGGTFTDIVLWHTAADRLFHLKVPTDHAEPHRATVQGVADACAEAGLGMEDLVQFSHGTTLALNALVERRGSPTGLLVTAGFRDLITLGRLRLPVVNHLYADRPEPLVPRKWVREVPERILPDGTAAVPLDRERLLEGAGALVQAGVRSLAVCFLHAYRHPRHEQEAVSLLRAAFPDLFICASSEVWPQQREYERALATILNAYVGDRMVRYLGQVRAALRAAGSTAPVCITRSNGGVMSAAEAVLRPVDTLLSGPASGVTGAWSVARRAGLERVITFDMGGTTADVAILHGGLPYAYDHELGGLPLTLPAIAISSVGAGGGSVVWVDRGGLLKVGPHSAGADPGPVCYGRGGTEPTVTDAYVVTGMLDPNAFLGGRQTLDREAALAAFVHLGKRLGLGPVACAQQVLAITTANMYAEFVPLMARSGIDFREFGLLAYGGAGPTHAFLLADSVGMNRVVIPPNPGTLCALGALMADFRSDFVRSVRADASEPELEAIVHGLEVAADAWLETQGVQVERRGISRRVEARYRGQAYEVSVDLPAGPLNLKQVAESFHQTYNRLYGFSDPRAQVELVNLRVQAVGETEKPGTGPEMPTVDRTSPAPVSVRPLRVREAEQQVAVFRRSDLLPGTVLSGPAIVEQPDTTVLITPGWQVWVDPHGNLVGDRERDVS